MNELDFIARLLDDLAPFVRERAGERDSLQISEKSEAADLVTQADLDVQRRVEQALADAFPGDALVAEEAGRESPPGNADARCWVLDPIDGTHNFARGFIPAYGISLACVVGNQPVAAGVAMPGLNELLLAEKGGGTTRNGRSVRVSEVDDLDRARVGTDLRRMSGRAEALRASAGLLRRGGQVRCYGACVAGLCAVAAGGSEAYVHAGPKPWDFAAGLLLVREAGGRATRADGAPAGVFDPISTLVAGNARMHETVLELVNEGD